MMAIQPKVERTPFFCVTAYSTHVLQYVELARHLGEDQSFYLLRIPDLDTFERLDSIEAMADDHLEQLRRVQPQGPYRLGGWSLSGWIAFEMARRLRDRGEEVELVMFDSHAPSSSGESDPVPAELVLPHFVTEIWSFFQLAPTRNQLKTTAAAAAP